MKYFIILALIVTGGCKEADDSSGDLKTLDQLAGSKNIYTCQTESIANYPSAQLIERIVIGNTKCSSGTEMSSDCKEVAKAVATVPKVFQDAFLELGGSIKVGGDTDQICGVTLKKGEAVEASKIKGIDSCWAIAASDREQSNSPDKVVVIAHKDIQAAKQYTTRVFGYFASQALPFVNADGSGSYTFDFNNNTNRHISDALTSRKTNVANQFVREINTSKDYSMTSMASVLGEALDYVKINGVVTGLSGYEEKVKNRILAFSDYVSADAFDSVYCGAAATTDARLSAANSVFKKTIKAYNDTVHPALVELAASIAKNGSGLNLTASDGRSMLMQILGLGAALFKRMAKADLRTASNTDSRLAGGSTCGSGTCKGCSGCSNGNCNCAGGSCAAGGCSGGTCSCGGACSCCGPSMV